MGMHYSPVQWLALALGATLVGIAKTGIAGVGIFGIALFASIIPAKQSTGALLPLLICADIIAVKAYRRHAIWHHLWRLFPWAAAGIVLGWLALGKVDDKQVGQIIGVILLCMVALHYWRRWTARRLGDVEETIPTSLWFVACMGLLAGFTTMMANAAGPIMILYLLSMRLPKMEFIGTGAWYFFILNTFKIPFSYQQQLITPHSLLLDALLAPCAFGGALFGKVIFQRVSQALFENLSLWLTVVFAIRVLVLNNPTLHGYLESALHLSHP